MVRVLLRSIAGKPRGGGVADCPPPMAGRLLRARLAAETGHQPRRPPVCLQSPPCAMAARSAGPGAAAGPEGLTAGGESGTELGVRR